MRQLVCPDSGQCTYLLVDEASRSAALVDPLPSLEARVREALEALGAAPRWILDTTVPQDRPAAGEHRYASLLATLGLGGPAKPPGASAPTVWERMGAVRVGPARSWISRDSDGDDDIDPNALLLLRAGSRHLEIAAVPTPAIGDDCYTIGEDEARPSFQLVWGRARVALGATYVHAVPVGRRDRVAWRLDDRVFTGCELGDGETPEPLLALPSDTLLYPGRVRAGLHVATVRQESVAEVPARPDAPWQPIVLEGGSSPDEGDAATELHR